MPNRVLRDWTDSKKVNKLSEQAEVFFTRLIMKADDFGCYTADIDLIASSLYPKRRQLSAEQVQKYLNECINVRLVFRYTVGDQDCLYIPKFGQRLRTMRRTYPPPPDDILQTIDSEPPPDDSNPRTNACPETETKRNETETESETETKRNAANRGESPPVSVWPSFDNFWEAYGKKTDRKKCEKSWAKIKQGAREKIMIHLLQYIGATPDLQYRKNPYTYLNDEAWKNEVIENSKNLQHGKNRLTAQGTRDRLNSYRD